MKKRTFDRIAVSTEVPASIFHDNYVYAGKVVNISNKGIYLETETPLPFDSKFLMLHPFKSRLELHISLQEKDLKVAIKLKRLMQNENCQGIAAEVIHPEIEYLEFVDTFRTLLKHANN